MSIVIFVNEYTHIICPLPSLRMESTEAIRHHRQWAFCAQLINYGILTDTLKNRSVAFVGECHAASVKFSLPQIV